MHVATDNTIGQATQRLAIATLWIAAVIGANLTAGWFLPLLGVQFAVGTLMFGVTFTLRDMLHRFGRKTVYTTIAVGALVNLAVSFALDIPLRIILASFTAIVIAETVDTEVFHALRKRRWWVRAVSSNAIAVPLDTLLFTTLAFGGILPWVDFFEVNIGDTLVKFAVGGTLIWMYHKLLIKYRT